MIPHPFYDLGLIAAMIGVALFFHVAITFLKREFEVARERYRMGMRSQVEQFRYFLNSQQKLPMLNLCSTMACGLMGLGLGVGVIGLLFGACAGWLLPDMLRTYFRKRRLQRLNVQFVQALVLLANAMKAGESLVQAFESTKQIIGGPMAQELSIITGEIRVGTTPSAALNTRHPCATARRAGSLEAANAACSAAMAAS